MSMLELLDSMLSKSRVEGEELPKVNVKIIEPEINVDVITDTKDIVKIPLIYDDVLLSLQHVSPVDSKEVVPWMHNAGAVRYLSYYSIESYRSLGGEIASASDDPWIPGLKLDEWAVVPVEGKYIGEYIQIKNLKTGKVYNVKSETRSWLTPRNTLFYHILSYDVQWVGLFVKFRKYASLPVTEDKQFPINNVEVYGKYMSIPFVGEYKVFNPFVAIFFLELQVYDSVSPLFIITDYSRNVQDEPITIYEFKLPKLSRNKQYRAIIKVRNAPMHGYVELYADGVKRGPTIIKFDVVNTMLGVRINE